MRLSEILIYALIYLLDGDTDRHRTSGEVRNCGRSASVKTHSAAVIRGAVASAVITMVIEVSIVAKLNAMALKNSLY